MSHPLSATICSLMHDLAVGLRSILGNRLVGLYLGGSAAMGDFCEASSDLDFLAITEGPLSPEDLLAIGMLHTELLNEHPLAVRLEGDYAPRHFLVATGTTVPVPGCERGVFRPKVGEIMLSADNIYNVRASGIPFEGPDPREILPDVTPNQVRAAVREMLTEGPGSCHTPEEAAHGILNLCRSFCTLQSGRPSTKSAGAAWAMENLEPQWHPVIQAAMDLRCNGVLDPTQDLCGAAQELDQHLRQRYL
ncbi:MAG: aminoglycoside adenylyltransferase domain-containing protein [Bacillota bacterium]